MIWLIGGIHVPVVKYTIAMLIQDFFHVPYTDIEPQQKIAKLCKNKKSSAAADVIYVLSTYETSPSREIKAAPGQQTFAYMHV